MFIFALITVLLLPSILPADPGVKISRNVTIAVDGHEWEYVSSANTVGGILKDAGVALGAKDKVYPTIGGKPYPGMKIRVTRITEKVVTQTEVVKFKTITRFSPTSAGKSILREGVNGSKEVKYVITYKDGVKVSTKAVSGCVTKQPVNRVVSISRGTFLASRDGSYTRSLMMYASAYDPGPRSCGRWATGRTACGMRAGRGVVAVDPRVIRLGTHLYVEGYGYCVAGDTGGAIKGLRIDLGFNTYSEAIRYGRKRVRVYILD